MLRHGRDELLRPRSRLLDILCPDLQHILEVRADVAEFSLQHQDHILCWVLAGLSIWTVRCIVDLPYCALRPGRLLSGVAGAKETGDRKSADLMTISLGK